MAGELPDDLEIDLLLEAIFRRFQHDFRGYARASLRRRLLQALDDLDCESVSVLQHTVLHEPDGFARLAPYLTVHVSSVFRDPAFFRAIREEVVPLLRTWASLKVWVAGCSTGEEAWSLAVILAEEGLLERSLIYATDISARALAVAEGGVYDLDRAAEFSRNYLKAGGRGSLSDHLVAGYDRIKFDRRLRSHMVFSDHSLATDAVFSEVHLVTCRNVLIYFDADLQDRAVGLFRDALVRGGFLGLGSGESLRFGRHADAFETFDVAERLYRRGA